MLICKICVVVPPVPLINFLNIVFQESTLIIAIVQMLRDIGRFFAILLLFMISYSIMQQNFLYPNSLMQIKDIFDLNAVDMFRKPYYYDSIAKNTCVQVLDKDSKATGGSIPRCPDKSIRSSILVAGYMIVSNLILVNTLIAIFSNTYQRIIDSSVTEWSWHRYDMILEGDL